MCYNNYCWTVLAVQQQFASVAQLDRASDSDSEGRRFDSCQAHHVFKPFEAIRTAVYFVQFSQIDNRLTTITKKI